VKKRWEKLLERYRVTDGGKFRLEDVDPADTCGLKSEFKPEAKELLQRGVDWLAEAQEKLYAQDRWAVLLIFQAMDAAGKDGTIKHVMSGVNPQGCEVYSFKQPSSEELDHDFLWRCTPGLPNRGHIGIFNRSYYEEVLVVRVHPEFLAAQKLPPQLVGKRIWKERYEDINGFERYLARNGTVIRKFFLHVSKAEQKRRFLARLDTPGKEWKFSAADVAERAHWDAYMEAFEDAITATSTAWAPWYVIPADNKKVMQAMVARILVNRIGELNLSWPEVSDEDRAKHAEARTALLAEEG
jgi:PPK2 family polyphosphate:nucleotide phosphotransferase